MIKIRKVGLDKKIWEIIQKIDLVDFMANTFTFFILIFISSLKNQEILYLQKSFMHFKVAFSYKLPAQNIVLLQGGLQKRNGLEQ